MVNLDSYIKKIGDNLYVSVDKSDNGDKTCELYYKYINNKSIEIIDYKIY